MKLSEGADAELLGSGSPADYGVFYDRHVGVVRAYVASRVGQPEVLFDLVAETFARALEKRALFDPARGPAVGWLLGIARNLIVDSLRHGQVEAVSRVRLGMATVELDDEQLVGIMDHGRDDLRAALGSTPADQREAVLRRVVLDESYTKIAGELRCSESAGRCRVRRRRRGSGSRDGWVVGSLTAGGLRRLGRRRRLSGWELQHRGDGRDGLLLLVAQ